MIALDARLRRAWWLYPHRFAWLVLAPIAGLLILAAPGLLAENGVVSYISPVRAVGLVLLVVAYGAGSHFGFHLRTRRPGRHHAVEFGDRTLVVLFLITIAAYVVWFSSLIAHPAAIAGVFLLHKGAIYTSRGLLGTTPGITTFTQAGIVFSSIVGVRLMAGGHLSHRMWTLFYVLLAITLFRVVVMSERLAIIEFMVPMLPFIVARIYKRKSLRWAIWLGPFFAVSTLIVFFGVTEYFRSWINHYSDVDSSYFEFVINRIGVYYTYAINTGFGVLNAHQDGSWFPVYSFSWLLNIPGVANIVHISQTQRLAAFLSLYGDAQFNNVSGVVTWVIDFGWIGATLVAVANGTLIGMAWRGYVRGEGLLRYLYPVLAVGMFDMIREPYLGQGRSFLPIVLMLVCYYCVRTSRGRRRHARAVLDGT